ncbi:trehalose-6-phosphate synthase [Cronobacter turicensis]|uniref:alpha,alpha-trehalose-phosphate synthase (UDP-forming) n=1 Tax=Cronobacter turicensis TaxID=413502 RepID=UPI003570A393
MSRLVMISSRCGVPHGADAQAEALHDIMRQRGGLWMGWSGAVGLAGEPRRIAMRETAGYTRQRWDMSPAEYAGYYHGYVHQALWPVFHNRPDLAAHQKSAFSAYKAWNEAVAEMAAEEICPDDIVWVQDYHLIPLGRGLKEAGLLNPCGFFLHQPFPPGDVFRTLPEHDWLMRSLFYYDLIGFQSGSDVNNFLMCVMRHYRTERLSATTLRVNGHIINVGVFPCGVATHRPTRHAPLAPKNGALYSRKLIVSDDVINDISGIHYRIDAMRNLLNNHPQYLRDVTLLQLSDPAKEYPHFSPQLERQLARFCSEVNGAFGDLSWFPVNYLHNDALNRRAIAGIYARSRAALFTPLSEGVSLSAKAYVLAQDAADPGVLILSQCSGTAEQLKGAMVVNPYDASELSEALHSALAMPLAERKQRHTALLTQVRQYDNQWWASAFLDALDGMPAPPRFPRQRGIFTPQNLY